MTTINGTKQEFVDLINGLFAAQDVEGKEFALLISKNISILREELKDIEQQSAPPEEFLEIAREVNKIAQEDSEGAEEKIAQLEKDNEKIVTDRRMQLANIQLTLKDEISVELYMLSKDILPDNITAKQINQLENLIT